MDKKLLRKKYLEKRIGLSPARRQQYSEQICELFLKNFQVEGKLVSLFLPIERKFEINTYLFLERLQNIGASVCLTKSNFEDQSLKHIVYDSSTVLATNEFGIPEPKNGYEIEINRITIVLVPLLICDNKGNRVGYGKGFYDRFLQQCSSNCKFVGINYFSPIEEVCDVLESDVPLHFLITPNEIIKF
jgi:5-formyltetrahydrofolate cyclo-ligase